MKMPSFKLNMTPGRRFAAAFWIGWGFHLGCSIIVDLANKERWVAVAIVSLLALTLMIIYSNNRVKFEKEFMWMTIKTGGPKKEVDPFNIQPQAGMKPMGPPPAGGRPPPPPAPPPKRSLGGGR